MSRHVDAFINGTSIYDASPLVILREPRIDPVEAELTTAERPGQPGALVISNKRTRLTVTLGFVLRNIFDLAARDFALEQVNAWAKDGILTLSSKPFRQLRMIVTKRASMGEIRDYQTVYAIECAAITCPFWQGTSPSYNAATGASGTIPLRPEGTVERVPLEFIVTPASAAMTSFSISVGGQTMAFSGFSLAAGKSLKLYYDENMLQWITLDGVSSLGARTRQSADRLAVIPGQQNSITYTANTSVAVEVSARGLFL